MRERCASDCDLVIMNEFGRLLWVLVRGFDIRLDLVCARVRVCVRACVSE